MNFFDILTYALKSLKKRKKRTILTTLGVMISISTMISISSLSTGFNNLLNSQFAETLEMNILRLNGKSQMNPISEYDSLILETEINHVDLSFGLIKKSIHIYLPGLKDENISTSVICVNFDKYRNAFPSFQAESGKIPKNDLLATGIIIGKSVADEGQYQVGDMVCVELSLYNSTTKSNEIYVYTEEICAILIDIQSTAFNDEPNNNNIYLSDIISSQLTSYLDEIIVILDTQQPDEIQNVTREIHTRFPDKFDIVYSYNILKNLDNVFAIITTFLQSIAYISLIVAGFGIVNIMIMSISERTREIGILKSLGARNKTILYLFLVEVGCIGVMGCFIGLFSGYGLAYIIAFIVAKQIASYSFEISGVQLKSDNVFIIPTIEIPTLLIYLIIGIITTICFGIYPAHQASKLHSVDALRSN